MKLNEKVLQRVRMIEEKGGIRYAKPDGKLYKTLRIISLILVIWTVGINLIFISGMLLVNSGTDNFKSIQNSVITVSVCTLFILAGYILSCFKFKVVGGVLTVLPEFLLIPVFAQLMEDTLGLLGYKYSFYWRHFAPLLLLAVFAVWYTVIAVRARLKTEKQYKKVLDNLYEIYHLNSGEDTAVITDEQWEEFLTKYDPKDYASLFKENE